MTTQPKILINSRSTSDDLRAFTGAISSCANTAAALRKVWNPANRQNADKDASAPPIFRRAMAILKPMIGLEYGLAASPADADRAIEAAARAAGALIDVTIPALKAATVKDFFGALEEKLDYTQDAFIKPGFYMRAFNRDIDPAVDLTAAAWVAAIAAVKKADVALWDYLAAGNAAVCLSYAPFIDSYFSSQVQAAIAPDDDRLTCVSFLETLVKQVYLVNNVSVFSVQLELGTMAKTVSDADSLEQVMSKIRGYSGLLPVPAQVLLATEAVKTMHSTNLAPSETAIYMLKIETHPELRFDLAPLVFKLRAVEAPRPHAAKRSDEAGAASNGKFPKKRTNLAPNDLRRGITGKKPAGHDPGRPPGEPGIGPNTGGWIKGTSKATKFAAAENNVYCCSGCNKKSTLDQSTGLWHTWHNCRNRAEPAAAGGFAEVEELQYNAPVSAPAAGFYSGVQSRTVTRSHRPDQAAHVRTSPAPVPKAAHGCKVRAPVPEEAAHVRTENPEPQNSGSTPSSVHTHKSYAEAVSAARHDTAIDSGCSSFSLLNSAGQSGARIPCAARVRLAIGKPTAFTEFC